MLGAAGVVALGIGGTAAWRAQAAARSRARAMTEFAAEEADRLADLAERLNRHGFELQHTVDELAPRLRGWTSALRQPLLAAAIPWVLRRLLGRPLRRRH